MVGIHACGYGSQEVLFVVNVTIIRSQGLDSEYVITIRAKNEVVFAVYVLMHACWVGHWPIPVWTSGQH
eukprot:scaffold147354_cov28-Prasinocladus_malaysianus.AAC.1